VMATKSSYSKRREEILEEAEGEGAPAYLRGKELGGSKRFTLQ